MPHQRVNDVNLYYISEGMGEEIIIFSHGLLWSHKMFKDQIDYLKGKYSIIAYDHRGQGQSEVTDTVYDMEILSEDARQLIGKVSNKPVHFVGLSMGGFVGMRLAARYPELIKSLTLIDTSANAEPHTNLTKYKLLNFIVKYFGIIPIVQNKVMPIMFGQSWLNDPKNKEQKVFWKNELRSCKKSITKSVEAVIYRNGVEDEISKIMCPTMIIVGDEDVATVPEKARFIQNKISGSKLSIVKGAGHSSTIEKPAEINKLLEVWFSQVADSK
jgi:pimeloyl-ACP methyl ester carboxylesterase